MQREDAVVEAQQVAVDEHAPPLRRGASRPVARVAGLATRAAARAMAASASTPVSAKMPGTPMNGVSAGATTSESAKVAPIVMPIAAIARERTESRVRSAASASTAAEMAPAPWMMRPDDRPADRRRPRGDEAAEREDEKARDDDGFSSPSVRCPAEGNLQQRLREAVGPERDADQRVIAAAGERFRIQREHRQDDEHAEHPQPEDAGEADGGATLGGRHARGRAGGDGGRRAVVRHGADDGAGEGSARAECGEGWSAGRAATEADRAA